MSLISWIICNYLLYYSNGSSSPSWYLSAHGWEGSFYYNSVDSQDRPGGLCEPSISGDIEKCQISEESISGAYLYPDFYTAVVGLWQNHLLIQVFIFLN